MWPSLLSILSGAADKSVQGAVQGFAGSAGAIASIAGLIIGGALFGVLGSGVFLLPAVLVALTVVLSFRLPATEVAQTPS
jgi:MFS family permease